MVAVIARREFLSLATGVVATLAGCADAGSAGGSTATSTPPFQADPRALLLTAEELPQDVNWGDSNVSQSSERVDASYEVLDGKGNYSHQISLSLARRPTVEGAALDHEKLVSAYRDEENATVEPLSLGDQGTLVGFDDETHLLVAFRNVSFNFGAYDDGPAEQLRRLAERQLDKLRANLR